MVGAIAEAGMKLYSAFKAVKKVLPIKGKFKKHKKFFYLIPSSCDNNYCGGGHRHGEGFVYLVNSGLRLTGQQAKDLINAGLWKLCPQCVAKGGPQNWTFHNEEDANKIYPESKTSFVHVNGQIFDVKKKNVGGLPSGVPKSLASVFYLPTNLKGQTTQIVPSSNTGDTGNDTGTTTGTTSFTAIKQPAVIESNLLGKGGFNFSSLIKSPAFLGGLALLVISKFMKK